MMKTSLVLSVFLFYLAASIFAYRRETPNDCLSRRRAMDTSAKKVMVLTNPKQILYENEDELYADYCIKLKYRLDIISNYKPCLRSFPYHLFNVAVRDMKHNAKRICSSSNERQRMVYNMKCFTKETYPSIVQLGYQTTSLLDYMATTPNGDTVVPAMCCGYRMIADEAKVTIDELCRRQGIGPSGLRYFQSIAVAVGSDNLEMVCRNYTSVKECQMKIPETVSELRILFEQTRGRKYRYTPITSLLKVIDRIDKEDTRRRHENDL